jgi:hypothetical protein
MPGGVRDDPPPQDRLPLRPSWSKSRKFPFGRLSIWSAHERLFGKATKENTMRYLCLVYCDDSTFAALTSDEKRALDRDSLAYDRELERSGHFVTADALQPITETVTVRVRDGRMSVTDGPFAETKEQVGGFILIEARDMNEAIRAAAGIPLAKLGSIEVRPILKIEA